MSHKHASFLLRFFFQLLFMIISYVSHCGICKTKKYILLDETQTEAILNHTESSNSNNSRYYLIPNNNWQVTLPTNGY